MPLNSALSNYNLRFFSHENRCLWKLSPCGSSADNGSSFLFFFFVGWLFISNNNNRTNRAMDHSCPFFKHKKGHVRAFPTGVLERFTHHLVIWSHTPSLVSLLRVITNEQECLYIAYINHHAPSLTSITSSFATYNGSKAGYPRLHERLSVMKVSIPSQNSPSLPLSLWANLSFAISLNLLRPAQQWLQGLSTFDTVSCDPSKIISASWYGSYGSKKVVKNQKKKAVSPSYWYHLASYLISCFPQKKNISCTRIWYHINWYQLIIHFVIGSRAGFAAPFKNYDDRGRDGVLEWPFSSK